MNAESKTLIGTGAFPSSLADSVKLTSERASKLVQPLSIKTVLHLRPIPSHAPAAQDTRISRSPKRRSACMPRPRHSWISRLECTMGRESLVYLRLMM